MTDRHDLKIVSLWIVIACSAVHFTFALNSTLAISPSFVRNDTVSSTQDGNQSYSPAQSRAFEFSSGMTSQLHNSNTLKTPPFLLDGSSYHGSNLSVSGTISISSSSATSQATIPLQTQSHSINISLVIADHNQTAYTSTSASPWLLKQQNTTEFTSTATQLSFSEIVMSTPSNGFNPESTIGASFSKSLSVNITSFTKIELLNTTKNSDAANYNASFTTSAMAMANKTLATTIEGGLPYNTYSPNLKSLLTSSLGPTFLETVNATDADSTSNTFVVSYSQDTAAASSVAHTLSASPLSVQTSDDQAMHATSPVSSFKGTSAMLEINTSYTNILNSQAGDSIHASASQDMSIADNATLINTSHVMDYIIVSTYTPCWVTYFESNTSDIQTKDRARQTTASQFPSMSVHPFGSSPSVSHETSMSKPAASTSLPLSGSQSNDIYHSLNIIPTPTTGLSAGVPLSAFTATPPLTTTFQGSYNSMLDSSSVLNASMDSSGGISVIFVNMSSNNASVTMFPTHSLSKGQNSTLMPLNIFGTSEIETFMPSSRSLPVDVLSPNSQEGPVSEMFSSQILTTNPNLVSITVNSSVSIAIGVTERLTSSRPLTLATSVSVGDMSFSSSDTLLTHVADFSVMASTHSSVSAAPINRRKRRDIANPNNSTMATSDVQRSVAATGPLPMLAGSLLTSLSSQTILTPMESNQVSMETSSSDTVTLTNDPLSALDSLDSSEATVITQIQSKHSSVTTHTVTAPPILLFPTPSFSEFSRGSWTSSWEGMNTPIPTVTQHYLWSSFSSDASASSLSLRSPVTTIVVSLQSSISASRTQGTAPSTASVNGSMSVKQNNTGSSSTELFLSNIVPSLENRVSTSASYTSSNWLHSTTSSAYSWPPYTANWTMTSSVAVIHVSVTTVYPNNTFAATPKPSSNATFDASTETMSLMTSQQLSGSIASSKSLQTDISFSNGYVSTLNVAPTTNQSTAASASLESNLLSDATSSVLTKTASLITTQLPSASILPSETTFQAPSFSNLLSSTMEVSQTIHRSAASVSSYSKMQNVTLSPSSSLSSLIATDSQETPLLTTQTLQQSLFTTSTAFNNGITSSSSKTQILTSSLGLCLVLNTIKITPSPTFTSPTASNANASQGSLNSSIYFPAEANSSTLALTPNNTSSVNSPMLSSRSVVLYSPSTVLTIVNASSKSSVKVATPNTTLMISFISASFSTDVLLKDNVSSTLAPPTMLVPSASIKFENTSSVFTSQSTVVTVLITRNTTVPVDVSSSFSTVLLASASLATDALNTSSSVKSLGTSLLLSLSMNLTTVVLPASTAGTISTVSSAMPTAQTSTFHSQSVDVLMSPFSTVSLSSFHSLGTSSESVSMKGTDAVSSSSTAIDATIIMPTLSLSSSQGVIGTTSPTVPVSGSGLVDVILLIDTTVDVDNGAFATTMETRLADTYNSVVNIRKRRSVTRGNTTAMITSIGRQVPAENVRVEFIVMDSNNTVPAAVTEANYNRLSPSGLQIKLGYPVQRQVRVVASPTEPPTSESEVLGVVVTDSAQSSLETRASQILFTQQLATYYQTENSLTQNVTAQIVFVSREAPFIVYIEFELFLDGIKANSSQAAAFYNSKSLASISAAVGIQVDVAPYALNDVVASLSDYVTISIRPNTTVANVSDPIYQANLTLQLETMYRTARALPSTNRRRRAIGSVVPTIVSVRSATPSVVVIFYLADSGVVVGASSLVAILNRLTTAQMAAIMNAQIVSAPAMLSSSSGAVSTSSDPDLWIIAAVVAPIAAALLIIGLIYWRWTTGGPQRKIMPEEIKMMEQRDMKKKQAPPNGQVETSFTAQDSFVEGKTEKRAILAAQTERSIFERTGDDLRRSMRKKVSNQRRYSIHDQRDGPSRQRTKKQVDFSESEDSFRGPEKVVKAPKPIPRDYRSRDPLESNSAGTRYEDRRLDTEAVQKRQPHSREEHRVEVLEDDSDDAIPRKPIVKQTARPPMDYIPAINQVSEISSVQTVPPVRFRSSVKAPSILDQSLPPLGPQPSSLVSSTPVGLFSNPPAQQAQDLDADLKQKAEIERRRNKDRLRSRLFGGKRESSRVTSLLNNKTWQRSQSQISSALEPIGAPLNPYVKSSKVRKRRRLRRKNKIDISSTSSNGVNNTKLITPAVRLNDYRKIGSPRLNSTLQDGEVDNDDESDNESQISMDEARNRMHALLDDAFTLLQPLSKKLHASHSNDTTQSRDGSLSPVPRSHPSLPAPPPRSPRRSKGQLNGPPYVPFGYNMHPRLAQMPPVVGKEAVAVWDPLERQGYMGGLGARPMYAGGPRAGSFPYQFDPNGGQNVFITPVQQQPDGLGGMVWSPYAADTTIQDARAKTTPLSTSVDRSPLTPFSSSLPHTRIADPATSFTEPHSRFTTIDTVNTTLGGKTSQPLIRAIREELLRLSQSKEQSNKIEELKPT